MSDMNSDVNPVLGLHTFEDNLAFFMLLRAATTLVTSGEKVFRDFGAPITIKEFDVLAYVGMFGPIRPRDLLKKCVLIGSPQTLSSVLDRLEKRDLLSREPDENDVRGVLVVITEEGTEQLNALFPLLSKKMIGLFNLQYTDEELLVLAELLGRL